MRVLVANEPKLLRECLALEFSDLPGLEVAMEEPKESAIIRSAIEFRADVAFVTLDDMETRPRKCAKLFRRLPHTQILVIGRKSVVLFWFEQHMKSMRLESSLDAILQLFQGNQDSDVENPESCARRRAKRCRPAPQHVDPGARMSDTRRRLDSAE
jgi:hypothetical protein